MLLEPSCPSDRVLMLYMLPSECSGWPEGASTQFSQRNLSFR